MISADPGRQEGDERKFGSLSVSLVGKGWFDFAANTGGLSAIRLVAHLKQCGYTKAVEWTLAFLGSHPGTGPCGAGGSGGVDDGDATPASAADCRDVLERAQEGLAGNAEELYLGSRGLPPPYPPGILRLPYARIGESALVAKLTEHGRVTGVMLTYLTPDGKKSLVEPQRRRFNLERSPGGVFRIAAPRPAEKLDGAADYLICEGVEDALSLALLDRNLTILGVPGVGAIQHLDLPKGAKVTIVRDGDEPGSAPDRALITGVDALKLGGVSVRVTQTPLAEDANSLLRKQDLEALRKLAARPPEADLSFHGRIIRLSKITDPVAYAKERKAVSEIFKGAAKEEDRVKISVTLIRGSQKAAPAGRRGSGSGSTTNSGRR